MAGSKQSSGKQSNLGLAATLLVLSAASAVGGRYLHGELGLVPAANKPYLEWEQFYSFYL